VKNSLPPALRDNGLSSSAFKRKLNVETVGRCQQQTANDTAVAFLWRDARTAKRGVATLMLATCRKAHIVNQARQRPSV